MTTQVVPKRGFKDWDELEEQFWRTPFYQDAVGLLKAVEKDSYKWITFDSIPKVLAFIALAYQTYDDRVLHTALGQLATTTLNRFPGGFWFNEVEIAEETWRTLFTKVLPRGEIHYIGDGAERDLKRFCEKVVKVLASDDLARPWSPNLRWNFYKMIISYNWYPELLLLPEMNDFMALNALAHNVRINYRTSEHGPLITQEELKQALEIDKSRPWVKRYAEVLCVLMFRFNQVRGIVG